LFAATTATMYSYSLLHWLVGRVGTGDFGRLAASQELSSTLGTLEKSICWQRPAKSTWQEQSKKVLLGLAVPFVPFTGLVVLPVELVVALAGLVELVVPLAGLVVFVVELVVPLAGLVVLEVPFVVVLTLRFC